MAAPASIPPLRRVFLVVFTGTSRFSETRLSDVLLTPDTASPPENRFPWCYAGKLLAVNRIRHRTPMTNSETFQSPPHVAFIVE
jgi:hypothetical protein